MTPQSAPSDDLPLRGVRVLVTRPREDVGTLQQGLERVGAEVLCLPTISIRLLTDSPEVGAVLGRLRNVAWIVFTSRNAVRAVFEWLERNGRQLPPGMKVAAVGPSTSQALRVWGVTPDCVPSDANARALAAELISAGVQGQIMLLPLGNLAGDEIRTALERAGALVTVVRVYETTPARPADSGAQDALRRGEIDVVALASPSAFEALVDLSSGTLREPLHRARLVAIGPSTADAIRAAGYTPSAVSPTQTMDGIVQAIIDLYTLEQ